uniref:Uncharacterized protein n=1 Tax=Oryza glumipatula TaxID=40148 RepID=A0A0D9Z901_9ORYZ
MPASNLGDTKYLGEFGTNAMQESFASMPATILAKIKEKVGAWIKAGALGLQEFCILRDIT